MTQAKSFYGAFDLFPSSKGAAIHIYHMAGKLFEQHGPGLMTCLGNDELPHYQNEDNLEIYRFKESIPNYLTRALSYVEWCSNVLKTHGQELKICHFRDPWTGKAVISTVKNCKIVYEINGLPSIELPFTYKNIQESTLNKIRSVEKECWDAADEIITPAYCIKNNLIKYGVPANKITVIPNGAELRKDSYENPIEDPYVLYIGALQPWQGVDILLKAFSLLVDFSDLKLVICSSTKCKRAKNLLRLVKRLGLEDKVIWNWRLSQRDLQPWLAHASVAVAPLIECARNLKQGCSPLKVLEYMAHGRAVVASDLPAVTEIINSEKVGKLIRAGRPSDLARAIRILLEFPEEAEQMGERARKRIEKEFTWGAQMAKLEKIYEKLLEVECLKY
ncbi:MAG: glycosyltransferase family 4 protein [Lentisphaeraceae bacterium]|nr:glycosyltransferase family 4 protein [Lentisphaeraceae bacterium]